MKATADRNLACAGIKRVRPFNHKNLPQLVRLYKKGWPLVALKRKWHCYGNPLAKLLIEAGVYRESRVSAAPEYNIFVSMRWHCAQSGGRIKFLFKSFDHFLNEVGLRPSSEQYRLKMVDRNKHYAPGNLHWLLLHHKAGTPEYRSYSHAKNRCTNPQNLAWENYGGRGIKFRFASFEEFFAELGARPPGTSLDRIDNDGNYEVGNVRWATPEVQANNRRTSINDWEEAEIPEAP